MVYNNTTTTIDVVQESKSTTDVLNQVSQNFIIYLPLILLIFGLIGFLGNVFTYLQAELRSNTCCIYSLCGSIVDIINLFVNSFPSYLSSKYRITALENISSALCKVDLFFLIFLPHLSINFLVMAIIDRYACTCSLTSPIRRLIKLKMVPIMIGIAIIISCLASFDGPLFFNLKVGLGCVSTQPTFTSVWYVTVFGLMQPIVMVIFVFLTYQNVLKSRRRVGGVVGIHARQSRIQFIVMIFAQIFTTGFFSLQWIIMYMYFTITLNDVKTSDQWVIIFFVFSVSNNCYYLNNVKSFYISMLTSRLYRKTFYKGLTQLLPRHVQHRVAVVTINNLARTQETIGQRSARQRLY